MKAPQKGAQGRMFQAGEKVEARAQRHQGQECSKAAHHPGCDSKEYPIWQRPSQAEVI